MKSNFWASSCAASSYETIGKVPFPGFFLHQAIGEVPLWGSFFVASSWGSCICSVFLRNILLGNCWDSVFFWQQSIGEFPSVDCSYAASYWGRALFGPSVVSSCWGTSTCRAPSASKFVGNSELPSFCASYLMISIANCGRFRIMIYLKLAPSPHLAISVHQIS